jgi:hypothetical protein
MAARRGWGEDSAYFDHSGECRDPDKRRHCPGRWRGVVTAGADGQRIRRKVSGRNKSEVRAKLAELHDELEGGLFTQADYTVRKALEDWLTMGCPAGPPRRSARTPMLKPLSACANALYGTPGYGAQRHS